MNLSSCGIDCDACRFKTEQNCPGCYEIDGKPFWSSNGGTKCDLYECAEKRVLPHCGKCRDFPCNMLKDWASAEGPERIDNLRIREKASK
ncbi:MAG: DUF3795 domain-containing protein [Oscillospiraceae bacterium]|nr:DUF3795 domain-containing protein [Oscillospiraceae bacterium]